MEGSGDFIHYLASAMSIKILMNLKDLRDLVRVLGPICIAYIQAVGRPLSPAFDMKMMDQSGKCTLEFYPEAAAHCLSQAKHPRVEPSRPQFYRSFELEILSPKSSVFAILLEHYKGKWPFWLSPRQAIVCPVSDKSQSYALEVRNRIHDAGFYVDVDTSDRTIQKKVREVQLAQYNYILVVGKEDANTGQVSVRVRDKANHAVKSVESLLADF